MSQPDIMSIRHARATDGAPTALTRGQLVERVRRCAADVAAGRYPSVEFDAEQRWHRRIARDALCDLWLISWLPSQGTRLHDHGESTGAFAVVSGELDEAVYERGIGRGTLTERRRRAGTAVGFGSRYVHDVRNLSRTPAVSVHAYSPPLTTMNFYDVDQLGRLSLRSRLATDDPETEPPTASPASVARS